LFRHHSDEIEHSLWTDDAVGTDGGNAEIGHFLGSPRGQPLGDHFTVFDKRLADQNRKIADSSNRGDRNRYLVDVDKGLEEKAIDTTGNKPLGGFDESSSCIFRFDLAKRSQWLSARTNRTENKLSGGTDRTGDFRSGLIQFKNANAKAL